MEAENPAQQPRHAENWDNESPDELSKRRRRKRKRRPQTHSNEDIVPQERYAYPDDPPRPYIDMDFENTRQTTEMPKRRRKKTESRPIRWTDDVVDIERPVRRRGQRRKRPSLDTWPELSEFRIPASIKHEQVEAKTESIDPVGIDDIREESPQEDIVQAYDNEHEFKELITSNLQLGLNQRATNIGFPLPLDDGEEKVERKTDHIGEDKSLSEFSSEVMITAPRPTKQSNHLTVDDNNNSSGLFNEFDKAQVCLIIFYRD